MEARKVVIAQRLESTASGRSMTETPSGQVVRPRATVRDLKTIREKASRVESFSGHELQLQAPTLAFVEAEFWDKDIDGPFDPKKVVDHKIGNRMVKGIWKQHGRQGVHIQKSMIRTGYAEYHAEADNSGPLGEERVKNRVSALEAQVDDYHSAQAPLVAPAGPSVAGLDALSLVRALGLAAGSSADDNLTASGQIEEVRSSPASDSDSDDPDASSSVGAPGGSRMWSKLGGVPVNIVGPKPTAKALPAAMPKLSIPKSAGSEAGSRRGGVAGSARIHMGSAPSQPQPAPTLDLCDGRTARLQQGLESQLVVLGEKISSAKNFLVTDPPKCLNTADSLANPRTALRQCMGDSLKTLKEASEIISKKHWQTR